MTFPLRQAHLFGQLVRRRGTPEIYWCEPDMGGERALRRLVSDVQTYEALFRPDAVRICDSLRDLPEGRPILPGSGLVKLQGTDEIYFLDGSFTRLIGDWMVFERCNFDPGKVKPISRSAFDAHAGSTPLSETYRQPSLRYSTGDIDDGEWATFVDALKGLKRAGRYDLLIQVHSDNLARVHTAPDGQANINFLPWHRAFLLGLNRLIQDFIGNPTVAFPFFWSWTLDAHRAGYRGDLWNDNRLGGYGEPIQAGPFRPAEWPTVSPVGNAAFVGGLQRTLNFPQFPIPADLTKLLSWPTFEKFSYELEMKTHGWIHNGIGGHMNNLRHSPNDPAFWLHHANVDRIWARWQRDHPEANARTQEAHANDPLPPTDLFAGARPWTFGEASRIDGTLAGYPAIDEWPP